MPVIYMPKQAYQSKEAYQSQRRGANGADGPRGADGARGAKRSHIYLYVTYICQRRGAHRDRSKEHRERVEDTAIGATEE